MHRVLPGSLDHRGTVHDYNRLTPGHVTCGPGSCPVALTARALTSVIGRRPRFGSRSTGTSDWREGRTGQGHQVCGRSEEHTSELQSLRHLVCRLLLEKK